MAEIAEHVGCSRGYVYQVKKRHVGSRIDELLEEVLAIRADVGEIKQKVVGDIISMRLKAIS